MLRRSPRPPTSTRGVLLFVHGARHGAWCWEVRLLREMECVFEPFPLSVQRRVNGKSRRNHSDDNTVLTRMKMATLTKMIMMISTRAVSCAITLFALRFLIGARLQAGLGIVVWSKLQLLHCSNSIGVAHAGISSGETPQSSGQTCMA